MNKKAGEVCSTVSDRHHTVYEHFLPHVLVSNGAKLHTVGRLDLDTEGLLLFTNDGKLSDFLSRPENKISRTYFVRLKQSVSEKEQAVYAQKAQAGLILPAEKKIAEQKSCGAKILWQSQNECTVTLCEGKFHEVKRIFRALLNEVVYLQRIQFAFFALEPNLKAGQWRPLLDCEVKKLYSLSQTRVACITDS